MRKWIVLTAIIAVWSILAIFPGCNDDNSSHRTVNEATKKKLERGEYLANFVTGCIDCHSKRDFTKFSGPVIHGTEGGGGFLFDEKMGLPGKIYGKNISSDDESGIGKWTDDEIMRAITKGISRNGDTLFPIMPYAAYNQMNKEDLLSIIAYIKTLKAVRNKIFPRKLYVPIAAAYPAQALGGSIEKNVIPSPSDQIAYGKYLVTIADCGNCHTPMIPAKGFDTTRSFAGGNRFEGPGYKVMSANITPDSTTGIGTWNESHFLLSFTKYADEKSYNYNPGAKNSIMPYSAYGKMKVEDLKAIYAYLHSIKPITNLVSKNPAE